jgi:hypothetical protein
MMDAERTEFEKATDTALFRLMHRGVCKDLSVIADLWFVLFEFGSFYWHAANRQRHSRSLTGLSMSPPAGDGAELQLAFAPFQAPELAGLNLVLQVLGSLEQRGFEGVVPGLGVQGWAVKPQRGLPCMAGGLGVQARAGHLQPHLDAEGRFGFPLVFEDHLGGGDRRQAMQVFELFLHLAVPGGLGLEAKIAKGGFHICSGMGLWLHPGTGSGARDGRLHPSPAVPTQATLTSICCGLAFWVLARWTVSTPSLNSALTFAGLASSGSEKLRTKLP